MPGNLLNADIGFPQFDGSESTDGKISVITNYLYTLLEQMRYTLGNLDIGNFNDTGFDEIAKRITAPITVDLKSVDEDITELQLTAKGLELSIGNANKSIAQLSLGAEALAARVESAETGLSQTVRLAADGITVTNAKGSRLTIDGGQINAENLNLTGRITFSDLTEDSQELISDTALTALTAQERANAAYALADLNRLPDYITETKITKTEIESPTITAATINSSVLNSPQIYTNELEVISDLAAKDLASIKFVEARVVDGEHPKLFDISFTTATTAGGPQYPTLAIQSYREGGLIYLGMPKGGVLIDAVTLRVTPGMVTNLVAVAGGGLFLPVIGQLDA